MSRAFLAFTLVYLGLCSACLFAPTYFVAGNLDALWLFGPPASLIYGAKFLWPFAIGTALIAGLFYAIVRVKTVLLRALMGLVLAAAWAFFGFIAYAPGA